MDRIKIFKRLVKELKKEEKAKNTSRVKELMKDILDCIYSPKPFWLEEKWKNKTI